MLFQCIATFGLDDVEVVNVFAALGGAAIERRAGVVFLIDDIHHLSKVEIEAQDRAIAEKSGMPPLGIKSIKRVGAK